ncbi:5-methylcytosine-specific restriction endonuclease McrA [Bacillus velezensis]|nr:5-methylcytosine-specific restriction endonuclease McrA [Bacillus velezensis]
MKNTRHNKHSRNKTITSFYKSTEWKRTRQLALIRDNHLCQHCLKDHCFTPAGMVHHIVEVKQDWSKRLAIKNLESLCNACHNKTHGSKGPNKSLEGKRTEKGDPPSVNKQSFSKFRKQQKGSSALPIRLGTTGFVVDFIVSRLAKKQAK